MLVAFLALLAAGFAPQQSGPPAAALPPVAITADSALVHHGRARRLEVRVPRIAAEGAEVAIDGALDEPVWRRAALLTGFSVYQPVDGQPAPDSTEVLLWYSSTHLHVGVRAFEPHASVRATLADRDKISGDDNVELHLDTFLDRRRAYVFNVNPLGVQSDGTRSEGAGFGESTDRNPDFLWESKGHVREWGYEVELRIPFTSLRYPSGRSARWGFNVVRHVQHSGWQQTWTPALRGASSFIAQEGTLVGLAGLERARVLEVIPEARSRSVGTERPGTVGGWRYTTEPEVGGNVRWGVSSNFTLNGTVKPDFSQVESDATEIASDPRFALFYAERRPFFVDAIEQFSAPNRLVYTRRIVEPVAAAKVTGKIGGSNIAFLSALDDRGASRSGAERPLFNILRVRRDVGEQSTAGLVYTDRMEGSSFNRVAGLDARLVFGRMYYAEVQGAGSVTRVAADAGGDGRTRAAPLWNATLDRTGRTFGFHYTLSGVHEDFATASGFVTRTNFVRPNISNRLRYYGGDGARVESVTSFVNVSGLWRYDDFFAGRSVLEDELSLSSEFELRGGWTIDVGTGVSGFAFDPADYAGRFVVAGGDTVPFAVSSRRRVPRVSLEIGTPRFRTWSAGLDVGVGRAIDFEETSEVRRVDVDASVNWRPTEKIRVDASYQDSRRTQPGTGATVERERIPRVRAEYQLARPLFLRLVGEYVADERRALRDPRTGAPILEMDDGALLPIEGESANRFRMDWLVSYRPTPGTVFFAGYGSTSLEREPLRFRGLERSADGFFVKASYLLKL